MNVRRAYRMMMWTTFFCRGHDHLRLHCLPQPHTFTMPLKLVVSTKVWRLKVKVTYLYLTVKAVQAQRDQRRVGRQPPQARGLSHSGPRPRHLQANGSRVLAPCWEVRNRNCPKHAGSYADEWWGYWEGGDPSEQGNGREHAEDTYLLWLARSSSNIFFRYRNKD